MSQRRSRHHEGSTRRIPRTLGWTALGLSLAAVSTSLVTGLPLWGFALGWVAFVAGMVGLGLKLLSRRTPRVTLAGLLASLVAIGVGAMLLKARSEDREASSSGPQREFGPSDDERDRVGGDLLGAKLDLNELTGDKANPAAGVSRAVTAAENDPNSTPGPPGGGDDPMLERFGTATVDENDDDLAVANLKRSKVVLMEELLPRDDKKLADVPRVVEARFVNPRATDDLMRKLGPSLSKLPNLRVLNLFGGTVSELGLTGIQKAPVLSEVILPLATDGVASQLTRFPLLRKVIFGKRGKLSDEALESLSRLTQLEQLDLGVSEKPTAISDLGLKKLTAVKTLKSLVISHNGVTSAGLRSLVALRQLERLDLSQTSVDDKGLEFLAEMPKLKSLKLRKTEVVGGGLEKLTACVNLQKLVLSELAEFDPDQLKHLVGHPALTELVLSGTRLDDRGVGHLQKMTQLKALDLNDCKLSAASVRSLKESLPNCEIEAVSLFQK